MITVREARSEDLRIVEELFGFANPNQGRLLEEGSLREWLYWDHYLPRWLVFDEDEPAGYVQMNILSEGNLSKTIDNEKYYSKAFPGIDIAKLAIVQRLVVAQDFRRKGLGQLLLDKSIEAAEDLDLVPGAVVALSNPQSRDFFLGSGWWEYNSYDGSKSVGKMISFLGLVENPVPGVK